MRVAREFSRHAHHYDSVNIIQKKVIEEMIARIRNDAPSTLLDLGCGNGGVYRAVDWPLRRFVGVDFAEGMLARHPQSEEVELIRADLNDPALFEKFNEEKFDRIVSASALQWTVDLDGVLKDIASLHTPVTLAIFTSGTFRMLHRTAGIAPILRSAEEVEGLLLKHFGMPAERLHYTLSFDSVRAMFRYMKRSGVSGGRNLLSYKETKRLMETYPLNYLEYEVVLLHL